MLIKKESDSPISQEKPKNKFDKALDFVYLTQDKKPKHPHIHNSNAHHPITKDIPTIGTTDLKPPVPLPAISPTVEHVARPPVSPTIVEHVARPPVSPTVVENIAPPPPPVVEYAAPPPPPPVVEYVAPPPPSPPPKIEYVAPPPPSPPPKIEYVAPPPPSPPPVIEYVAPPPPPPKIEYVAPPPPPPKIEYVAPPPPPPPPKIEYVAPPPPSPKIEYVAPPPPSPKIEYVAPPPPSPKIEYVAPSPPPPPVIEYVAPPPPPPKIEYVAPPPPPVVEYVAPPPPPVVEYVAPPPPPPPVVEYIAPPPPTQLVQLITPTVPKVELVTPAPIPKVELVTPASIPKVELIAPAPIPKIEFVTQAPIPKIEFVTQAPIPKIELVTQAPIPKIEFVAPKSIPKVEIIAPEPSLKTEYISAPQTLLPEIEYKAPLPKYIEMPIKPYEIMNTNEINYPVSVLPTSPNIITKLKEDLINSVPIALAQPTQPKIIPEIPVIQTPTYYTDNAVPVPITTELAPPLFYPLPQPIINYGNPVIEQPLFYKSQPTQQVLTHGNNYNQLPMYSSHPIQQPQNYNQQPQNYNQQPQNYNQQPQNYNQQPQNYNQQPQNYNQQPQNYNEQPFNQNKQNNRPQNLNYQNDYPIHYRNAQANFMLKMVLNRNNRKIYESRPNDRFQRENKSPIRRRSLERPQRIINRVEEVRRRDPLVESDLPPIDREKVCPMLVKVFCSENKSVNIKELNENKFPGEEFHIYTWKDATLKELTDLVKDQVPKSRIRGAYFDICAIFPDFRRNSWSFKKLGSTCHGFNNNSDSITLRSRKFQVGDFLHVDVVPPRQALKRI